MGRKATQSTQISQTLNSPSHQSVKRFSAHLRMHIAHTCMLLCVCSMRAMRADSGGPWRSTYCARRPCRCGGLADGLRRASTVVVHRRQARPTADNGRTRPLRHRLSRRGPVRHKDPAEVAAWYGHDTVKILEPSAAIISHDKADNSSAISRSDESASKC